MAGINGGLELAEKLSCKKGLVMRKISWVTFPLLLLVLLGLVCGSQAKEIILNNVPTQIYFSPQGGCTDAIVGELNKAKKEVLVQAYSFTSRPIAKALIEAHQRGVRTEIILDKSQKREKYSVADFTAHMGVRTYIDSAHSIAHNKIMLIDQEKVITGSFNFTRSAEESNAENVLIIKSHELAMEYIENWERHKAHSEQYEGR